MSSPVARPVAPARTLGQVLRRRLQRDGQLSLLVGKVTGTPDSKHVTVQLTGGAAFTVPKLAGYTAPVVGEACYLLSADTLTIALGAVR